VPRQIETTYGPSTAFRLGDWLIQPSLNRLSRGEEIVQIELKAMDVLMCLADRAGQLVSKRELIDTVWRTEFVAENTLPRRISSLRTALGDDSRNPRYIETIPKRGYRLIAEIAEVGENEAGGPIPRAAEAPGTVVELSAEARPYPGLETFTERDAAFFFGREVEVAALWRKIITRRLLAVVGPSGVGKSSFLRAGVIPAAPPGWGTLVCQPGDAPLAGLARGLVPIFAGNVRVLSRLVDLRDSEHAVEMVRYWRDRHEEALLAVDQFEELFTLNPPEVHEVFAEMIDRLAHEEDVHVVLSMRDDFLYACHEHSPLAPIFHDLTPLAQPVGGALERALIEPAARCGFAFEDDELADEMMAEVAEERGALPLMAFSLARLWELRDLDRKLLTRRAYREIGGVAGALARHAEATLAGIGEAQLPIVREIFRNLVTASGTRAVRDADELLSVFDEQSRDTASGVLNELIDARLLTSYEVEVEDQRPDRRVEIIHESLLERWPRLVSWRTQDADAARLRDQLRQAARLWQDKGRPDDLLWTGTAFREYLVWRERYPGGLSEVEEAFATAMTAHATRRRRRRRLVVGAVIVALLAGLAVVGSFWRTSVREARRASASELVALGRLELGSYPTSTLAHATASLRLADSAEARRLALEALWQGPTAFISSHQSSSSTAFFNHDGSRLAHAEGNRLRIVRADGGSELLEPWGGVKAMDVLHGSDPDVVGTRESLVRWGPSYALWSVSERRRLGEIRYPHEVERLRWAWGQRRLVLQVVEDSRTHIEAVGLDGRRQRLGTLEFGSRWSWNNWVDRSEIDRSSGNRLAAIVDGDVLLVDIGDHGLSEPRAIGSYDGHIADVQFIGEGRFLAVASRLGSIQYWDLQDPGPPRIFEGPDGDHHTDLHGTGRLLEMSTIKDDIWRVWIWSMEGGEPTLLRRFDDLGPGGVSESRSWDPERLRLVKSGPDTAFRLWRLAAPAGAEPIVLRRGESVARAAAFHPGGEWLATTDWGGLALWPLVWPMPSVIRAHTLRVDGLVFEPRGRWLASAGEEGTVRLWPLDGEVPPPGRVLLDESGSAVLALSASPDGTRFLAGCNRGARLFSLDGEKPQILTGIRGQIWGVAFSPDGRLAAAVGGRLESVGNRIRVWDAETGELISSLDPGERLDDDSLAFRGNNRLLAVAETGLVSLELPSGRSELLLEGSFSKLAADAHGRLVLLAEVDREGGGTRRAAVFDLETGTTALLASHGESITRVAIDATGTIAVTGDADGVVRVGPITGEEPHLLLGHEHAIYTLAVDPGGRWLASADSDPGFRIWPMPNLSKPPLHTLPRGELIAKLESLTNLRVVRDEGSPTGWKLDNAPFPGWETTPSW
jgi:WD40 repeat protein/DNA-binding winged helix-turn-helix (wHTH) protein